MHLTHEWFSGQLAQERAGAATQRATSRRLRVAAGADAHSTLVARIGSLADRLRDDERTRRDAASATPFRPATNDDLVRAA